jgi:hypothetical protein
VQGGKEQRINMFKRRNESTSWSEIGKVVGEPVGHKGTGRIGASANSV